MMEIKNMIKNKALESGIHGFEFPDYVTAPDENGDVFYQKRPKALVYKENGDVEFNLYYARMPEIESAEIRMMGSSAVMEKMADNRWTATISGIEPGVHVFMLVVNGITVLHPQAPVYFNGDQYSNYVDVPDPENDTYLLKDVPHGQIRQVLYYSAAFGQMKTCMVYTPAGYDESEEEYPVLYLQHGGGENEMGWFAVGKANMILDNLIAEGKCKKMIVVCNNGFIFDDRQNYRKESHLKNLCTLLSKDCAPFIEKNFRVKTGKENRAVAGLSMGSYQTQIIAYTHPEFADYYGFFSGATLAPNIHFGTFIPDPLDTEPYYQDIPAFNASHKFLFVSKGNAEGGLTLQKDMQPYLDRGIEAELYTCEGNHEFQTWRRALGEFLPKLF